MCASSVQTNEPHLTGDRGPARFRQLLGWVAVAVSTGIACFWAYWGIIENFHEGWYFESASKNIAMMLGQYVLATIVFVVVALVAIRWPRIGGSIHFIAAAVAAFFFRGGTAVVIFPFIVAPLAFMGVAYWFGQATPRRWAAAIVAGAPLIVMAVFGSEPAYRVANRVDDGIHSARRITQNGVELIWAPGGPGWPLDGVPWEEAKRRCRYLNEDGLSLSQTPQNIWRLPTIDEAVRSMQRHGQNCNGTWDATSRKTTYQQTPDKESPLWDTHSKVIYWWTADEKDTRDAYIIVYDGRVWPRHKDANWGYLGFRAVKSP